MENIYVIKKLLQLVMSLVDEERPEVQAVPRTETEEVMQLANQLKKHTPSANKMRGISMSASKRRDNYPPTPVYPGSHITWKKMNDWMTENNVLAKDLRTELHMGGSAWYDYKLGKKVMSEPLQKRITEFFEGKIT